jgi:hypothetical protein
MKLKSKLTKTRLTITVLATLLLTGCPDDKDTNVADNTANAVKDTDLADKDAGVADKDTGLADKDTGLADKDTDLSDKDTDLADKDAGVADKDTGLADKDTDLADKDTDLSDKDTDLADKDAGVADKKTVIVNTAEMIARLTDLNNDQIMRYQRKLSLDSEQQQIECTLSNKDLYLDDVAIRNRDFRFVEQIEKSCLATASNRLAFEKLDGLINSKFDDRNDIPPPTINSPLLFKHHKAEEKVYIFASGVRLSDYRKLDLYGKHEIFTFENATHIYKFEDNRSRSRHGGNFNPQMPFTDMPNALIFDFHTDTDKDTVVVDDNDTVVDGKDTITVNQTQMMQFLQNLNDVQVLLYEHNISLGSEHQKIDCDLSDRNFHFKVSEGEKSVEQIETACLATASNSEDFKKLNRLIHAEHKESGVNFNRLQRITEKKVFIFASGTMLTSVADSSLNGLGNGMYLEDTDHIYKFE